jgi:hypothetical protein
MDRGPADYMFRRKPARCRGSPAGAFYLDRWGFGDIIHRIHFGLDD